ncbi:MAG: permease-like cell division protein FtsX [Myxococcota bacterium]|nr:permease-like cell division protein FtsX [Myxococcota bacterium]
MLPYILRRTLRSLWENLSLNLVVVGVIGAGLLVAGAYLQVMFNLDRIVDSWDRDVHISTYFFTDVPVDRRFAVKDDLAKLPEVAEIFYVSEDDAQAYLEEKVPDVQPILDELGAEILPASLEITLREAYTRPTDIAQFVEKIQSTDFENIDYGQEWVQRFNNFLSLLQLLGVALGSLIAAAVVFLVANTMHLVVYARKAEMETMKLVGATWTFISTPFVLEGAILGALGSSLSILGMLGIHKLLFQRLQGYLQLALGAEELAFPPPIFLWAIVGAGVLLGVIGCWASVRRFWKAAS